GRRAAEVEVGQRDAFLADVEMDLVASRERAHRYERGERAHRFQKSVQPHDGFLHPSCIIVTIHWGGDGFNRHSSDGIGALSGSIRKGPLAIGAAPWSPSSSMPRSGVFGGVLVVLRRVLLEHVEDLGQRGRLV